ncbi:MAG TPA: IS1595 family transposase, partial [Candidatus Saccharimonadales bacterium]|nr:IS1595 family transposase [Candidatus Saccharimonadales bacterium]
MRYTFEQFNKEYPNDDVCLDSVFENRFGDLKVCPNCAVTNAKFYRVKNRKSYACKDCGYHLYPLANTIFHKTTTSLRQWFFCIYLFSVSKNGVSAKEIVRHVGVSYPTAHRMAKQIRKLMADETGRFEDNDKPKQIDETYIGGKRKQKDKDNKTPVIGVVETGGNIK